MTGGIQRIAITTGGGDAPGLNAVIRAVVLAASRLGWECWGIRDGFNGLLAPATCLGEPVWRLSPDAVHGIGHLGGTILGSTNRGNPLRYPVQGPDGLVEQDRSGELAGLCRQRGFDALVMVGGDSSMEIADRLHRLGVSVVGVPKTIDNDLDRTFQTFGFDTAVGFATECIDRLHATADSQHRVMVVEVMGRYAGWIALHAGLAGGAHAILLPEIPFDIDVVADAIGRRDAAGRRHAIVVAAEGAQPLGGAALRRAAAEGGHAERLGGIGAWVEAQLARRTGKDCRSVVLGHLLRGGSPSAFDRIVAARFGAAAVRALARGESGVMVALDGQEIGTVPLSEVAGRSRRVPVEGDTVRTARELGICFGEAGAFDPAQGCQGPSGQTCPVPCAGVASTPQDRFLLEAAMYKRILLPTDGSEASRRAILYGVAFARSIGAETLAMTATPEFHTITADREMLEQTPEQHAEASRARAQRLLDEVLAAARDAGVPCKGVQVVSDEPYEAIIATARQHMCDLIVMASHGRRGIKGLLLGSETQKVLVHSSIPVLVHR